MTRLSKLLNRRLQRLEQSAAGKFVAVPCPSPAPELARWLASRGFVSQANESMAETMGKAMGLSMGELRAALLRRAAGLPV